MAKWSDAGDRVYSRNQSGSFIFGKTLENCSALRKRLQNVRSRKFIKESVHSMAFEVLDGALVLFCLFPGFESTEVSAFAGFGFFLLE
jgi:hypothetical protein